MSRDRLHPVFLSVPSALTQYPSFLIFSLGIEPSTTRTNGSSLPSSAWYQNLMSSSPFSQSEHFGIMEVDLGQPGNGAQENIFDTGLGGGGDRDRVTIAT